MLWVSNGADGVGREWKIGSGGTVGEVGSGADGGGVGEEWGVRGEREWEVGEEES